MPQSRCEIESIITSLDLKPHPEGGFYKETYRSKGVISAKDLSKEYQNQRSFSTCIYFLLTSDTFSAFHKIHQDEIWHFYSGSAIELHVINEKGQHNSYFISHQINKNHRPQLVVPGGHWFAASVIKPNHYALVGCTVAPGFDFDDFNLPTRSILLDQFPQHKKLIQKYTRE